jgi:hypothetical protein
MVRRLRSLDMPSRYREQTASRNRDVEAQPGILKMSPLFSFTRALLPRHLREERPITRSWWNNASLKERENALRRLHGFKAKQARFLAESNYSEVFGDRNPMAKKKKAKKKKNSRKRVTRRPRRRATRRNTRRPKVKIRYRTRVVYKTRRRRTRKARKANPRRQNLKLGLTLNKREKTKLARLLRAATGKRVRVQ